MRKNEQSEGYRDEALKLLKKADVEIGDKICLTREDEVFEGILIPVSEYSDGKHVVIKLKSGYNIGVRITENTKIEKTGEGTKPTFTTSEIPKQDKTLPKVAIISTGGTIASRVDYRTGAVRSALTASDLYSVVPELVNIAQIDAHVLFSIMSENMTPKHWEKIAETAAQKIAEGTDGVVIAHGTDTMGYTAAALSFALQNLPVPVILVGSQRSADRPSSDSATNLIGAVTAAAKAPLAEVAVAFHKTLSDTTIALHRGTKVRKCHTSRRDTFKSVNASPLATVQDQKVKMLTTDYRKRNPANRLELKPSFDDKVALIKFHPGIDSSLIDWHVEKRYKGIVLEGTGLGHVGKHLHDALKNAVKNDVVVGMASQCVWGRIDMNVYDSGRDLLSLGVIPLEDMLAETALVKLMWIFGQTKSVDETKRLLTTNIAGEFSPRTLPESEPC